MPGTKYGGLCKLEFIVLTTVTLQAQTCTLASCLHPQGLGASAIPIQPQSCKKKDSGQKKQLTTSVSSGLLNLFSQSCCMSDQERFWAEEDVAYIKAAFQNFIEAGQVPSLTECARVNISGKTPQVVQDKIRTIIRL